MPQDFLLQVFFMNQFQRICGFAVVLNSQKMLFSKLQKILAPQIANLQIATHAEGPQI